LNGDANIRGRGDVSLRVKEKTERDSEEVKKSSSPKKNLILVEGDQNIYRGTNCNISKSILYSPGPGLLAS
jgi:hypothetical protein